MKTNQRKAARRSAFTLADLLAVLLSLTILAVLVLATAATTRDKSIRAQCVRNLQQIGLALRLYADENNDSTPLCPNPATDPYGANAGSALCDLPVSVANPLLASVSGMTATNAGTRNVLFCPAIPDQRVDYVWNYYVNQPSSPYRTTGYFFMFKRNQPGDHGLSPYNPLPVLGHNNPACPREFISKMSQVPATDLTNGLTLSTTELVTDCIFSESQGTRSDNFMHVGSNVAALQLLGGYNANHTVAGGKTPAGDNVLFLDGHVSWRTFLEANMVVKWATGPDGPRFEWF